MNNESLDTDFYADLWNHALLIIREKMSDKTFDAMFSETKIVAYHPSTRHVSISASTKFTENYLREHYIGVIESAFKSITDKRFSVEIVADPVDESADETADAGIPPFPSRSTPSDAAAPIQTPVLTTTLPAPDTTDNGPLIARYTFDTFVIGASNRFAHAACLAVADNPGRSYNPLFIYGGVGLGKTHLMHAIGHMVRQKNPRARVVYLTTERFTNDFIMAIRDNTFDNFRNRYRSTDVLLIDDIQFIANKETTQEEFFHTFNSLHQSGKQIVISSDRPPREIPTLEDRLRSRFEWGLLTDIQPPDLETRIAILQRKAKSEAIVLPEDVYYFIANQIDSNIRELEGALIRVMAYSSLVNEEVTVTLAEDALKDVMLPNRPKTIAVHQIQKVIGDHYGIKPDELKAKLRTRPVAFARQVAMYLAREMTGLSLPKIGEAFGGRDHTTVMHACEKIATEMEKDSTLRTTIERLSEAIRTLS